MMHHQPVIVAGKRADGYVVELGAVNLVFVKTETGMAGCGAFNVAALDRFGYAAVTIAGVDGKPIATIDDLLNGTVKETNQQAVLRGVRVGMDCRTALEKL